MKVFAAKYTSCRYEYPPAVLSIHYTKEGAERAVAESQALSRAAFEEDQEYWRKAVESGEVEGVFGPEDEWTPENGAGDELWRVSEMEVLE